MGSSNQLCPPAEVCQGGCFLEHGLRLQAPLSPLHPPFPFLAPPHPSLPLVPNQPPPQPHKQFHPPSSFNNEPAANDQFHQHPHGILHNQHLSLVKSAQE